MSDRFRRPIVGVIGSGETADGTRPADVGRWIAHRGYHLLTGGGGGVMRAASEAYRTVTPRHGLVLGVIPGDASGAPPAGYPNEAVELVIRTHLPLRGERGAESGSRNHLIVLSSQVLVALAGRTGTATEVRLASRYGVPLITYLERDDDIPGLPDGVPRAESLDEVAAFVDATVSR